MELSTDLLANVTFREQWRGYSPDQVDEFLERLGVAIEELQGRILIAEKRATDAEAAGSQAEITRTLVLAQRTATAAVDEAKQEAALIRAEAESEAEERERTSVDAATFRMTEAEELATARLAESEAIAVARLAEAEAEALAVLADAQTRATAATTEADALVTARLEEADTAATARVAEADIDASGRLAAAESRLAELDREIERREREVLVGLDERREVLLAEVDAMVAFLEVGRARQREELQAQLAALDVAPDDPPPWARRSTLPDPATSGDEVVAAEPTTDLREIERTISTAAVGAAATSVPASEGADSMVGAVAVPFDGSREGDTGELPLLAHLPDARLPGDGPSELPLDPGRSDPVLARARADLADALREAGVLLEVGGEFAPNRQDSAEPVDAARPPDAADQVDAAEPEPPSPVEWRSVSIPDETDDDPFLAELRRAVTDTEPLGPREHEPTQEHQAYDDPEPGRFRLRRNRG